MGNQSDFVDDCVLYRRIHSSEDAIMLQKYGAIQEWEKDWLMEFHPKIWSTVLVFVVKKWYHFIPK